MAYGLCELMCQYFLKSYTQKRQRVDVLGQERRKAVADLAVSVLGRNLRAFSCFVASLLAAGSVRHSCAGHPTEAFLKVQKFPRSARAKKQSNNVALESEYPVGILRRTAKLCTEKLGGERTAPSVHLTWHLCAFTSGLTTCSSGQSLSVHLAVH